MKDTRAQQRRRSEELERIERFFKSGIVNLAAGPAGKVRTIQGFQGPLQDNIKFFADLFESRREKGQSCKWVRLPEDHPDGVEQLIAWFCYESLESLAVINPDDDKITNELAWSPQDVFAFADKYGLPKLRDAVMDVLRQFCIDAPDFPALIYDMVESGYHTAALGSVFRKYLATCAAYLMLYDGKKLPGECWSQERVGDLMAKVPDLEQDIQKILEDCKGIVKDPRQGSPCLFHTHTYTRRGSCPWKRRASD